MGKIGKVIHVLYPIFLGVISLLFFIYLDKGYEIEGLESVLESIINFSSIIIGFYTAMYGILLTLKDSDLMKKFREDDLNMLFKKQLYESLTISFVMLIISIAMQVLINYDGLFPLIVFHIWTFVLGYFVSISFRTISLLVSIMFNSEQATQETTKNDIPEEERNKMVDNLKK